MIPARVELATYRLGGGCREDELLTSCYQNVLQLAVRQNCESIAIPLLGSGNYGFPKGRALELACQAIGDFLQHTDLMVYLVVYDKTPFTLADALANDVEAYIDDNYVAERQYDSMGAEMRNFAPMKHRRKMLLKQRPEYDFFDLADGLEPACNAPEPSARCEETWEEFAPPAEQETFSERLFRIIDKKHLADVDVYKRANLDRKLFSKLRNKYYKPSKKTVLALTISLGLNMDEAADLLRYAGFALAPNDKQDLVVQYCLERKIYDIHMVNIIMFEYADKTL